MVLQLTNVRLELALLYQVLIIGEEFQDSIEHAVDLDCDCAGSLMRRLNSLTILTPMAAISIQIEIDSVNYSKYSME